MNQKQRRAVMTWFAALAAGMCLTALLASLNGCAGLPPYFTNPSNTTVFTQMGMNCVLLQPQEYAAGIAMTYLKTPTGYQLSQGPLIKVIVQCGDELYTVNCDPRKDAKDNPCAGLVTWRPVPKPPAVTVPKCNLQ
jgi:hypothetical protein